MDKVIPAPTSYAAASDEVRAFLHKANQYNAYIYTKVTLESLPFPKFQLTLDRRPPLPPSCCRSDEKEDASGEEDGRSDKKEDAFGEEDG